MKDFEIKGGVLKRYRGLLGPALIPESVTSIGEEAFRGCESLTSVTIPESVTSIEKGAFRWCTRLRSVTIPESVASIGEEAFCSCTSLRSVTIPESVTSIEKGAFRWCTSLTSVTIPESVTSIGKSAFEECSSLTSVTIPDSVISIGSDAFRKTSWIDKQAVGIISAGKVVIGYTGDETEIILPDNIKSIGNSAFSGCSSLRSVTIPESVTSIGGFAFYGCSSLRSVTIPDNVTSIGGKAFKGCTSLMSVMVPDSVMSIGSDAFSKTPWIDAKAVGIISAGKVVIGYTGDETEIVLPDSIKSIGDSAFSGCSSLRSVTIPDSVISIGEYAFYGCSSLRSVAIPDSVTSIGERAFYGCKSLVSITIPDSVISIGKDTFYGCSSLTSITIPNSVTSIGEYAFYGCTSLRSVTIPESVASIGEEAFCSCTSLRSVTIPESVTSIEKGAFRWCTSLTSVTIPESVTSIGKSAFEECSSLTSVTIPDSVTSIGKSAFSNCKEVTFAISEEASNGIKNFIIEKGVLIEYKGLGGSVVIPTGVTSIGEYVFKYCSTLTSVLIPKGVTNIEYRAFYSCANLAKVIIEDGVTSIGNETFDDCWNLTGITIPKSVTSISNNAFEDKCKITFESGYLCRPIKLPAISASEVVDPISCAYAMLYQSGKVWDTSIEEYIQRNSGQFNSILKEVIKIITEGSKEAVAKKAVQASLHYIDLADADVFKQLYSVLFEKKSKCLKMMIEDVRAQAILLDGRLNPEGIDSEEKTEHPVEKIVNENWKASETTRKLQMIITKGIPYADSGELSSPEAVIMVISSYADQIDNSINYYSLYQTSYVHTQPDAIADQIAASLDKEKLQELLEDLAFNKRYEKDWYLLPFGRYASPEQITKLNAQMRAWANWGQYSAMGRKNIIVGRGALMLSDTREAMMAVDKAKALDYYAHIRGTDAETLRDTVLSEFGFDSEGKKKYDLGGNTAVISLKEDLSLSIYDENAGKVVKSIPKKGSDEKQYELAKKDFSDIKKNIKRVITNRRNILFEAFLSEREFKPEGWKKSYLGNPVLNAIAALLVWQQNDVFFTCDRTGKTIRSGGEAYLLDEKIMIKVAHPMNMSAEEIRNWQKYFVDHGLKQPFEQVWEPVYKKDEIKEDRYKGCLLPVYRFAGKKAHGIEVWGYGDYSEDFGFSLKDCKLEVSTELWRFTHDEAQEANYELGGFKVIRYSRYANHIIYLLDKWTIEERISKNDPAIGDVLDGFTVVQLLEFIKLASDKKSTDSLAVLMDYKDRKYSAFDPMAEFTLD